MSGLMSKVLEALIRRQDLVLVLFMLVFVMMFIVPVPPIVIDILIATNIGLTLLVLVTATYLKGPLELSTFPAIILFTTVFRLAVTVASARMILSSGQAGEIIRTFGNFVVAGNVLVGLVVFLIVAIVQFIVVVKGAERISEVSARFTLDGLPGKQMSIDSELRNGDISRDEAKRRRAMLEKETQFFGAMDGAMRFVKGDSIAGFIVIFVNLIGGIMVGMLMKGLKFSEAGAKFSLLTVGEGLVAQIPAMFVAIAAGIVVTRVATDDSTNLGADIMRELAASTRALAIAAVVMVLLGFLPGFPTTIFMVVGSILGAASFLLMRTRDARDKAEAERLAEEMRQREQLAAPPTVPAPGAGQPPLSPAVAPPPELRSAQHGDVFVVSAGGDVLAQWQLEHLGSIWGEHNAMLDSELGFRLPELGFRATRGLPPGEWRLEVEGVPVMAGEWAPGRFQLLSAAGEAGRIGLAPQAIEVPYFGHRLTLSAAEADRARNAGLAVLAPVETIAQDMATVVRRQAARAFGIGEAAGWLDSVEQRHPRLVAEVRQNVPILKMVEVMRRLLEEQVSLSQPRPLLEALVQEIAGGSDATQTVEAVRRALSRQIVWNLLDAEGTLPAILLEPALEHAVIELANHAPVDFASQRSGDDLSGRTLAQVVSETVHTAQQRGERASVVVSGRARPLLRMVLMRHGVDVPVVAYQEVAAEIRVRPLRAIAAGEVGLARTA